MLNAIDLFAGAGGFSTEDARDFVSCGDCYTEGPCNPGQGSAANIEAWNRRALSAQPPADPTALCLRLQTEADMWRANGDENLCVLLEEAIAAISQPPAPSVPGWQWVPVEPTRDMCATANANMQYGSCTAHQVWAAMLSAAPPPVPSVHVGDSAFESWYSTYWPQDGSNKQRMRDAYAAGMLDRAPPPVRERLTLDAVIAMAVGAGLGHALSPIGLDTGKVFRTDAAYRTSELEEFARAIGRALIGGEG